MVLALILAQVLLQAVAAQEAQAVQEGRLAEAEDQMAAAAITVVICVKAAAKDVQVDAKAHVTVNAQGLVPLAVLEDVKTVATIGVQ